MSWIPESRASWQDHEVQHEPSGAVDGKQLRLEAKTWALCCTAHLTLPKAGNLPSSTFPGMTWSSG